MNTFMMFCEDNLTSVQYAQVVRVAKKEGVLFETLCTLEKEELRSIRGIGEVLCIALRGMQSMYTIAALEAHIEPEEPVEPEVEYVIVLTCNGVVKYYTGMSRVNGKDAVSTTSLLAESRRCKDLELIKKRASFLFEKMEKHGIYVSLRKYLVEEKRTS